MFRSLRHIALGSFDRFNQVIFSKLAIFWARRLSGRSYRFIELPAPPPADAPILIYLMAAAAVASLPSHLTKPLSVPNFNAISLPVFPGRSDGK